MEKNRCAVIRWGRSNLPAILALVACAVAVLRPDIALAAGSAIGVVVPSIRSGPGRPATGSARNLSIATTNNDAIKKTSPSTSAATSTPTVGTLLGGSSYTSGNDQATNFALPFLRTDIGDDSIIHLQNATAQSSVIDISYTMPTVQWDRPVVRPTLWARSRASRVTSARLSVRISAARRLSRPRTRSTWSSIRSTPPCHPMN